MKLVYMATADIAVPVLNALVSSGKHEIVAVVSQPDRPAGRKRRLTASPVKQRAEECGLKVLTPEKIGSPASIEELKSLDADLFVVFAYGQYIPSLVTDLPPHRSINVHPSLLPRYRGASPIQFTLLNGDEIGGVSIIYVDREMDAGDILAQQEVPVGLDDTTGSLSVKMAKLGGDLLLKVIDQLQDGSAELVTQDPLAVVETRKLAKEDGLIDWSEAASVIYNKVRAFNPWPSCSFMWNDSAIKVHRAEVEDASGIPGAVLDIQGVGPLIATGDRALRLVKIQPPGKRAMGGSDFLRGNNLVVGEVLP